MALTAGAPRLHDCLPLDEAIFFIVVLCMADALFFTSALERLAGADQPVSRLFFRPARLKFMDDRSRSLVDFGVAAGVVLIFVIVGMAVAFIVGIAVTVGTFMLVVGIAARAAAAGAARQVASTRSANATLNILISLPPQIPATLYSGTA